MCCTLVLKINLQTRAVPRKPDAPVTKHVLSSSASSMLCWKRKVRERVNGILVVGLKYGWVVMEGLGEVVDL